ncbi:MAG TPA: VC0807 family protein [Actinomycetota bacterium]|jgi:hypothetical protein
MPLHGPRNWRPLIRHLLPGLVLPGLIYFVVSRDAPTLVALAAASSVPLLDLIARLVRGRSPSLVGLAFVALTGASVGLAFWFHSPLFILVKGAAGSAVLGLAFAVSAAVRRPLTRTLAIHLTSDHHEERRHLAERWRHPRALSVFRTLSLAWGALLLVTAVQQLTMALTISPGMVMAMEPGVHLTAIALGTVASVLYVRRRQRLHPELAMLPVRAR